MHTQLINPGGGIATNGQMHLCKKRKAKPPLPTWNPESDLRQKRANWAPDTLQGAGCGSSADFFPPFVKLRVLKLGIAQVLQIMSSASVFCSLLIFRGGDMRLSTPLIPLQADTMISCTASSSFHGVGVLRIFHNSSMDVCIYLYIYICVFLLFVVRSSRLAASGRAAAGGR